jgi:AraC-like DNA-binding protein
MSLRRIGPAQRTRQTALHELVTAITRDPDVDRAWHSLRAGDREAAVMRALQRSFGGSAVRAYVPQLRERDADKLARQVCALAAAPSSLSPSQIAARLGVTPRHVRRILARG